jgi:predicted NUDIX family NTP pyrophosphohydrolase
MKTTYGIILFNKNLQILAVHPTRHQWNQWDIPKGLGDEGELPIDSIKREFVEETSIELYDLVPPSAVHDLTPYIGEVVYKNKKKKLHAFIGFMGYNLDSVHFKCNSMVEGFKVKGQLIEPFPEVDAFTWVNLKDVDDVFHESQVKAIKQAIDIYPLFNEFKAGKQVAGCFRDRSECDDCYIVNKKCMKYG